MTKLMFKRGNLYKGDPYAVRVEKMFGSSELHGPFSSENEAWNYGMNLAVESNGTESFHIVRIQTPDVCTIATADEVREYRSTTNQEVTT